MRPRPSAAQSQAATLALLVVVAAGCVAPPDADHVASDVPTTSRVTDQDLLVRSDSQDRAIRQATLRIRARTCTGVGSGSGFAVAEDLLVTNRHVVQDADVLQVSTWDGQSYDVEVSGIAWTDDLAVVQLRGQVPVTLELHRPPDRGDEVVAVGYPLGGELTFTTGQVLDRVDMRLFGEQTPSIRVSNRILPGNSGGPLLDTEGRVVGVVFALETDTGNGLAIPIDALERTARSAGFFHNPSPC